MTATYSLVVPVYKNEENIPDLLSALEDLSARSEQPVEVVFVIDGSVDRSGELLLAAQPTMPFASTIVFHSRNFGSFTAIRTGMEHVQSDVMAVMAADLQEPPELVLQFWHMLARDEADVVFGRRSGRQDSFLGAKLSQLFWFVYRKLVLRDVPQGGVDIFGCNRRALDAVLQIAEPNSSLIAQLFWIGFRRRFVDYARRQRQHGKSAWNLSRRVRYMMDSIFSFSDLPILLVLWVGIAGCLISLGVGFAVAVARLFGFITLPGYAGLVVLITFTASMMMAVQGVIGSYLWRTFENTKRRPLRVIGQVRHHRPPSGAHPGSAGVDGLQGSSDG